MRVRLLGGAVAMALTGCAVLASVGPASAQWRGPGWDYGHGPGAFAADVIGGTVAAVTSPLWAPGYYDYYPGYAYGPTYAAPAIMVIRRVTLMGRPMRRPTLSWRKVAPALQPSRPVRRAFGRTIRRPECIRVMTGSSIRVREL